MQMKTGREKRLAGKKDRHLEYEDVELKTLVGKTILAITWTTVEGPAGAEPCVVFYFTDGTRHGIVLPMDS